MFGRVSGVKGLGERRCLRKGQRCLKRNPGVWEKEMRCLERGQSWERDSGVWEKGLGCLGKGPQVFGKGPRCLGWHSGIRGGAPGVPAMTHVPGA